MQTLDITNLFFQEFYWGYLIDSKVDPVNLIRKELLWNPLELGILKGPIDDLAKIYLQFP